MPRTPPGPRQVDALFTPPPRAPGPQRLALDRTLRAWARNKHLTGAAHAAEVEFLRGLATNLDNHWTPGGARSYADALAAAAPPPAPRVDPREQALEDRALAIIADMATTETENDPNPTEGA